MTYNLVELIILIVPMGTVGGVASYYILFLARVGEVGGAASVVAQLVENPPAMGETLVQSLGWEDALEKGTATHSSTLAWRTPWSP